MEANSVKTIIGEPKKPEDGHGIGFFVSDSIKYPIVEQYEIPSRYNIDTLVLLPVNEQSIFLYWELTDKLLGANPDSAQLTIKVYEVKAGKKTGNKEIYSTTVTGSVGEIHIDTGEAFRPMAAAIGVDSGGAFKELVKSNQVNIPSFSVLGLKEEFFSNGIISLQAEKPKEEPVAEGGTSEGDNVPMEHKSDVEVFQGRSENFEKEMEIAAQLLDIRNKDTQSIELLFGLLERLRNFSSEDKALLEIIKRFYEARAEDVRLLHLFLEFIKFLGMQDDNKKAILEYFERLKDASAGSGSSEMLNKDKEAGR
ncbi:MAG: DUF4912 domain-containing protein [Nitrospirae bacterium YQR-1]